MSLADAPIWRPSRERIARSHLRAFAMRDVVSSGAKAIRSDGSIDYPALHRWSVEHREDFWAELWRYSEVIAGGRSGATPWDAVVLGGNRMAPPDLVLGPRWFPGARLNFAENLLRFGDDRVAIVSWTEEGRHGALTYAELARQVRRAATALRADGVGVGDRVAGFMPNVPETVIAMLATASLGAVWSSCSPDFGVAGVLDRFGQIEPKVLIAADGYRYAGKEIDLTARVNEIATAIPSLERVVRVPFMAKEPPALSDGATVAWNRWLEAREDGNSESAEGDVGGAPSWVRLPFDHPLYIMYSSGTTGLPKCMVHGAGGTLLQHLKEHQLHTDLRRDDVVFYFTTCGWMMWNWLVSALGTGATVILYDGAALVPSPAERQRATHEGRVPRPDILWEMAEAERITVFGTSARYLAMAEKEGLAPGTTHDLGAIRTILSTGSPLAASSFDYVYANVGSDLCLSSISGGTDIVSCFALGNPAGAVYRGELQVPGLAMAVDIVDELGRPVRGAPGELVCRLPFPSMPVAFWNDADGARYRAAYFDQFPGIWRHGDWAQLTEHGGLVITGRSDATLNPGGVRIGTAEIYRQVERLPEILESLVVGQEMGEGDARDVRIVLFVRLRPGAVLTDELSESIRRQIRTNASPHHVPRVIVPVADIPRTVSGKITELAVREVIHGRPVHNTDALANPQSLQLFVDLPQLRT